MKLWPVIEEKLCCVPHPFVSVTGGGGKTTFLISFGEYLKSKGYSVLLTTSTKLGSREEENYKVDYFFTKDDELLSHTVQKGESILFAHESSVPGKLVSPGEEIIKEVTSLFDWTIVEADGSMHLPLKYHSQRDPIIWRDTTSVVSLIGLWAIGKKSRDVSFGDERDILVDYHYIDEYLNDGEGACKGMRDDTKNIILFNGFDSFSDNIDEIKSLNIRKGISSYIVSEEKGELYYAF